MVAEVEQVLRKGRQLQGRTKDKGGRKEAAKVVAEMKQGVQKEREGAGKQQKGNCLYLRN